MKKVVIVMIFIVSIMVSCFPGFAQTIDSKEDGLCFTLSDDWEQQVYDGGFFFYHKGAQQEYIDIWFIESDWAYVMEEIDEPVLKGICDEMLSDQQLAQSLSEDNNAVVRVKTDSVISSYEYYNGIQFYRYEKAYTSQAIGFLDTSFYDTIYITAKNGKIYVISYSRNERSNHFSDLVAMLNSLSFANGEIKIMINNERIYPDSEPILVENRTLVPIRAVAEKMRYRVDWDEENQMVTLTASRGFPVLHFLIGGTVALKNFSEEIHLDVPAFVLRDRTYLPLRAVAEAMDAKVYWDEENRTVEIWE